jgi:hypothetical protein
MTIRPDDRTSPALGSTSGAARIVLVAGSVRIEDRPGHHDYLGSCRLLADLLEQTPGVSAVVVRDGWPDEEAVFEGARSIVLYNAGGRKQAHLPSAQRIACVQRHLDEGTGMVAIHRAAHFPPELAERALSWLGGAHLPQLSGRGHWWTRHGALPPHEVTRGVPPWRIRDGWLNGIRFVDGMRGVTPLVWAGRWHRGSPRGGARDVVAWTYESPAGWRAFTFTGLDAHSAWAVTGVRQLLVNGILWSARLPVPETGAPCALVADAIERTATPRRPPSRLRRLFPGGMS